MNIEELREAFDLAKRHNALATFERAMTNGWDMPTYRQNLLAARETPAIPGLASPPPVHYRGAGEDRYMVGRGGGRTLGELVFNSEAWREWKGDRSGGRNKAPRTAEFLELQGFENIAPDGRLRASNPFNASTESLTSIQKLPGVQFLDQQPLTIAKLFPQANTNGSTVRYTVEDTYTQAATAVAEGATKPAASLDVSEVDATVRKIAVYTKVSEEMLQDQEFCQAFINARLGGMVQSLEDNHLLNGTGATNQIKGVLNFTGLQAASANVGQIIFDAIAKAMNVVRGANSTGGNVEPTAIVMNALDWANTRLTKDQEGRYYLGGPAEPDPVFGNFQVAGMCWGKPVVATTVMPQGSMLTGDFGQGLIMRRTGLRIELSNSDQDDFIKNLVTIRAEERLALCIFKPAAFCVMSGITSVP